MNMNMDQLSHFNSCAARELGAQGYVAERETAVINRPQENDLIYFGRPHIVLRRARYDLNILRPDNKSFRDGLTVMREIDFAPRHSPARSSIHRLGLPHWDNVCLLYTSDAADE